MSGPHQRHTSSAAPVEVLELSADSLAARAEHEALLLDLEARRVAPTVDVPTLPGAVRDGLRELGLPVRLFGENLADVRERLRLELARREVLRAGGVEAGRAGDLLAPDASGGRDEVREAVREAVQYTHADPALVEARGSLAEFSLRRARDRLARERTRREDARRRGGKKRPLGNGEGNGNGGGDDDDDDGGEGVLDGLDRECLALYGSIRATCLEGSQFADARPLSAVCALPPVPSYASPPPPERRSGFPALVATGGWSGAVRLWDGSSAGLEPLATRSTGHEDRIMGIAMSPALEEDRGGEGRAVLATASIDLTGRLWRARRNENVPAPMDAEADAEADAEEGVAAGGEGPAASAGGGEGAEPYVIDELAVLRGHEARLCRVAFHPSGRYVATTSFDHTWRLWDVEAGGRQLLLQDGHWRETYGVGFHPDGSLCATTDFGGTVQVWDLRTGKSACHFTGGHAGRVLCSEFAPDGFRLASAGDDGTLKVWDLRRRGQVASVPAHSRLITQIRFGHDVPGQNGEYIATSSFDGTVKMWSTRDWRMLSALQGHEGKVMGVDVVTGPDRMSLVSAGFDKTLKLWK